MTLEQVAALVQGTILTSLWVVAPILAGATLLGLAISILQAATQVNEQTLTFVPKIVIVLLLFTVLFPWIMQTILDFSHGLLAGAPDVAGGP